jgi:hypothetical protein
MLHIAPVDYITIFFSSICSICSTSNWSNWSNCSNWSNHPTSRLMSRHSRKTSLEKSNVDKPIWRLRHEIVKDGYRLFGYTGIPSAASAA